MAGIELVHTYDPLLFGGSVLIPAFAGYVALWLIGRARVIESPGRGFRWLAAASAAMGVGIWSMHFTGMLALRLPVPVGYEPGLTLLSMVIAVAVSLLALRVVREVRVPPLHLAGASVLMGAAISGMHYTGMAALRLPGAMYYRPGPVAASVVVAVVASGAALALFLRYRGNERETVHWVKVVGGVVLGLAVSGMHYTGMAAARFRDLDPGAVLPGGGLILSDSLALGVGIGSLVLLGLGLTVALVDWRLESEYAAELQEREQKFRRVFRDSPVGIALVSAEGRPAEVNQSLAEMLGYEPEELEGMTFQEFTHPDDVDKDVSLFEQVIAGEIDDYQIEKRYLTRTGEVVWGDLRIAALHPDGEEAPMAMGFVRDITARKRFEAELEHRSLHDPLTGLANRTLLADRVEQGLSRARRRGSSLGLLMLDLDQFKRVNDRLGHAAGDRVLTEVARRLRGALREDDTVARWGGDEFFVVLPEFEGTETMADVKARIRGALRPPVKAAGESVHVEASIGAVVYGDESQGRAVQTDDPAELIRFASLALHWAKDESPAGFKLFDPEAEVEGAAYIRRERALREALEEGQIVPHYQPIVRLEDGATVGVEALARWRHPERGLVSPSEFIPLAEELGLVVELDEAVMRAGGREAAGWTEARTDDAPMTISFNLSGQQFEAADLADRLDRWRRESGLRAKQVIFEVTETSLMRVPRTIESIRGRGFQVYVDDFGTGYSTFAYLRDLELDGMKIDLTFVQGITDSPSDVALVETMLTLGRRLGLTVVAEGIETEAQRGMLLDLGCERGQGFLFARPMSGEEMVEGGKENGAAGR